MACSQLNILLFEINFRRLATKQYYFTIYLHNIFYGASERIQLYCIFFVGIIIFRVVSFVALFQCIVMYEKSKRNEWLPYVWEKIKTKNVTDPSFFVKMEFVNFYEITDLSKQLNLMETIFLFIKFTLTI